jgi:hypothetical protein
MQEAKSGRLSSHYPVAVRSAHIGLDVAPRSPVDFEQVRV